MEKLVYLFYPMALLLLLFGSKWYGRKQWNEEAFSLGQSKAWQGFFAAMIMLHHVGQKTCASWLDRRWPRMPGLELFVPIGYYFVAFFLLCSGFGLYKSWKKKENYLQGFVKKRVLPLVITFFVTDWVFILVRLALGEKMDLTKVIYYITGIQQPNPNAWFVIALPIFYLMFYLCFRLIKREGWALFGTCLLVLLWVLIGCATDHNDYWFRGEWWYNSALFFPLGLLFAKWEGKIVPHLKKYYLLYLVGTAAAVWGLYRCSVLAEGQFGYYCEWLPSLWGRIGRRFVTAMAQHGAAGAFVLFVYLVGLKVKIGNRALKFMSAITLEFYLVHGLFVELFAFKTLDSFKPLYYINNAFFYGMAVLLCAIPFSLLLRKLVHPKAKFFPEVK